MPLNDRLRVYHQANDSTQDYRIEVQNDARYIKINNLYFTRQEATAFWKDLGEALSWMHNESR